MKIIRRKIFTIIELFVALLLPALNSAREKAKEITCTSNLKQMGTASFSYSDDNDGRLPQAADDASAILAKHLANDVGTAEYTLEQKGVCSVPATRNFRPTTAQRSITAPTIPSMSTTTLSAPDGMATETPP